MHHLSSEGESIGLGDLLQSFQGRMLEFCCHKPQQFSVFQGLLTIIRNWLSKAGPDTDARE